MTTATLTRSVYQQLRDLRVAGQIEQRQIAETLGVDWKTVRRWDTGRRSPRVHHACAYAQLLEHQLVVTRDGAALGELQQLMGNLPGCRHTVNRSRISVAVALHTSRAIVAQLERRIASGQPMLLATLERYLAAHGCHIHATPAAVTR
jgi:DNA-binding XRE family transcriptional regulator